MSGRLVICSRQETRMIVQHAAIRYRNVTHREYDTPVLDVRESRRRNVVRAMLRHDDQVSMRHSVAMHDHAHALGPEYHSHPPPDPLGDQHDSL
jgi:hypothetical protein